MLLIGRRSIREVMLFPAMRDALIDGARSGCREGGPKHW